MMKKIVFAGFGGQGVLFAGKALAFAGMDAKMQISWLPSYGPEMRGGTANCSVILSDDPIGSPLVLAPDVLIAMNKPSLEKFEQKVAPGGLIVLDSFLIDKKVSRSDVTAIYIPAKQMAEEAQCGKLGNMIMLGAMLQKTKLLSVEAVKQSLAAHTPASRHELLLRNQSMLDMGCQFVCD